MGLVTFCDRTLDKLTSLLYSEKQGKNINRDEIGGTTRLAIVAMLYASPGLSTLA
ncbi:hypothetical protein ACE1CM_26740 [Microseira sp. BLCC-F43]